MISATRTIALLAIAIGTFASFLGGCVEGAVPCGDVVVTEYIDERVVRRKTIRDGHVVDCIPPVSEHAIHPVLDGGVPR